jgi:ribosomal protein S18 acetylase RimI-like enzyme
MTLIVKATTTHAQLLAQIGETSWVEAHGGSAPAEDIENYVSRQYTEGVILTELQNPVNLYHLIYYDDRPAGYSNIKLNAPNPNIAAQNVAELDRLYLLREFYNRKLGLELLQFNIELAKLNAQVGIWLYVWKGNDRALAFYQRAGFKITGSHDFKISDSHFNPNHEMFLML